MLKKIFFALAGYFLVFNGGVVFAEKSITDVIRIGPSEFKDIKSEKVGSARIKWGFSDENQYDTNIFLTPTDKKSGYINILDPELLVDVPMGIDERHLLQFLYNGQFGRQATYHKQSYANTELGFNGDFKLPFGYFDLQNIFNRTSDRAGTEFTTQVKREENNSTAAFGVEFNKFAFELGYAHLIENYVDPVYDYLKYDQDIYSSTLYYQLFPKTKALLEYDHGVIDYKHDDTRDGDFNQVQLGFKGTLTGKTIGIVKVGYQGRTYDIEGREGYNGPVAEAQINTAFSKSTEMQIRIVRAAVESIDTPNNYYLDNALNLSLSQRFFLRYKLNAYAKVQRNLYPESDPVLLEKRHDSIDSEGLTLEYEINDQWNAKLGYEYQKDRSNIIVDNYNDNLISFTISVLI